eukprot:TRINITY_DN1215_c0_g1_i12.p1 TRINITY_DN1215_c0_g1~~TRINITY_DN1215_c0_g1_i12.p1  ORF type:complete len:1750 (+),score=777.84 TRINITY_DN1215_c0_g1_i12:2681-7930(+)
MSLKLEGKGVTGFTGKVFRFSDEQYQTMSGYFTKFEQDGDGELNMVELKNLVNTVAKKEGEELDEVCKKLMTKLDTTKNGGLNFNEFLKGYEKMLAQAAAEGDDSLAQLDVLHVAVKDDSAEKAAKEKAQREKEEADRLARETEEADRLAREKEEADRLAKEKAEADRLAKEAADKAEADRLAREKEEADRLAREKAEADRLAKEAADKAAREKEEADRLAREKEEADRLAREKEEADRLAREKAEADRLAKEAADKAAREKEEADRLAREKEEADRLAREKEEADRLAREKAEADRLAKEAADKAAREKEEADRLAREKAEADRLAKEAADKAEAERLAREKEEADRLAKEREELERLQREREEYERPTAEGKEVPLDQAHVIKLVLKGKKLDRKDGPFQKSDPYLILKKADDELYHSEVKKQTLTPQWDEFGLDVEECGGLDSPFILECWDWDNDGKHDFIGSVEVKLRDLCQPDKVFPLYNKKKAGRPLYKNSGKISVLSRKFLAFLKKEDDTAESFTVSFRARNLDKSERFEKSDPFLVFRHKGVAFAKTEPVKDSQNPKWEPVELGVKPAGGLTGDITCECWNRDSKGKNDLIGETKFSLRGLRKKSPQFPLINKNKVNKLLYRGSGILYVDAITPNQWATLEDVTDAPETEEERKAREEQEALTASKQKLINKRNKAEKKEQDKEARKKAAEKDAQDLAAAKSDADRKAIEKRKADREEAERKEEEKSAAKRKAASDKAAKDREEANNAASEKDKREGNPHGEEVKADGKYVRLQLRGRGLDRKDGPFMKSDPYLVIKQGPVELFKSEVKKRTLDPVWDEFGLDVESCGGSEVPLRLEVHDFDNHGNHDFIGFAYASLKDLADPTKEFRLRNEKRAASRAFYKHSGKITVLTYRSFGAQKQIPLEDAAGFLVRFRAKNLDKNVLFEKSDPFLMFKVNPVTPQGVKSNADYPYIVAKTEQVKDDQNPSWQPVELYKRSVGGNLDAEIKVQCWNLDKKGNSDLIGEALVTLRSLNGKSPQYALVNPAKAGNTLYRGSGLLFVDSVELRSKEALEAAEKAQEDRRKEAERLEKERHEADLLEAEKNAKTKEEAARLAAERKAEAEKEAKEAEEKKAEEEKAAKEKAQEAARAKSGAPVSEEDYKPVIKEVPLQEAQHFRLRMRGKKLDRKDGLLGKSDPFLIFKRGGNELFKTEIKKQTLDPVWDEFALDLVHCGSLDEQLLIECWDWDDDGTNDHIGNVNVTLRQLAGPSPVKLQLLTVKGKKSGKLLVNACKNLALVNEKKAVGSYTVKLRGKNLDKSELFEKSDPFLTFRAGGVLLGQTSHVKNSQNPKWEPVELFLKEAGGYDGDILVECWNYDFKGSDLIGEATLTLRDLNKKSPQFALLNPAKVNKNFYNGSGLLFVDSIVANPPKSEAQIAAEREAAQKEAALREEQERVLREKIEAARRAEAEKAAAIRLEEEKREREVAEQQRKEREKEEEERRAKLEAERAAEASRLESEAATLAAQTKTTVVEGTPATVTTKTEGFTAESTETTTTTSVVSTPKSSVELPDSDICAKCKILITGAAVIINNQKFHAEHFNCKDCNVALAGRNCHDWEGNYYCWECYQKYLRDPCAGCGKLIDGRQVTALGKVWHPEHFVCTICKAPFSGSSFKQKDGKAYCDVHFAREFGPKCGVCQKGVGSGITFNGIAFHKEHFKCQGCLQDLKSGKLTDFKDKPYCNSCYDKLPKDERKAEEKRKKELGRKK